MTRTPPPPTAVETVPEDPPRNAPPGGDGETVASPFSDEEFRQFAAEDGRAGKVIGWLLCALFVYTILVASAAIWWTANVG